MTNTEIRNTAKEHGVPLWKIAEKFGITDSTFSRKLRKEFPEEDKKEL